MTRPAFDSYEASDRSFEAEDLRARHDSQEPTRLALKRALIALDKNERPLLVSRAFVRGVSK
jgi:hypothetical protein